MKTWIRNAVRITVIASAGFVGWNLGVGYTPASGWGAASSVRASGRGSNDGLCVAHLSDFLDAGKLPARSPGRPYTAAAAALLEKTGIAYLSDDCPTGPLLSAMHAIRSGDPLVSGVVQ